MRRLWTGLGLLCLAVLAGLSICNPLLIAQANERIFGSETSAGGGNAIALTATAAGELNVLCSGCAAADGITGTLTAGRIPYASGAQTLVDDADFVWNGAAVIFGGNAEPDLSCCDGPSNVWSAVVNGVPQINLVGADGGSGLSPELSTYRSRGTIASPVNMNSGDIIWAEQHLGYSGGDWQYLISWVAVYHTNYSSFFIGGDGFEMAFNDFDISGSVPQAGFHPTAQGVLELNQGVPVFDGGSLASFTLLNLNVGTGGALRTDTTTAHTALLQAYDTDTGPGYVTFGTLLNGNAPSLTIAPPTGGGTVSVTGGYVTAGAAPSVANVGANSCGTTAATIAGNNNAGEITVGTVAGTQCRVTFTIAAPTRRVCTVTDATTTIATRATYVDSTHTDFLGAFVAGDIVAYHCFAN